MSYYILSKCCSKNIRHSFTYKEDEQLKKLVLEYGEHDWKTIADNLGTRTPRQCRERYKNYLMPGIVNGPWTVDEDMLLYSKFHEIGPHWTIISQFFPSRSEINIKNRWAALSNKRNNKNLKQLSSATTSESDQPVSSSAEISSSSSITSESQNNSFPVAEHFNSTSDSNNSNLKNEHSYSNTINNCENLEKFIEIKRMAPKCQIQSSSTTKFPTSCSLSVKSSSEDEDLELKNKRSVQPLTNFKSEDQKQEMFFSLIEHDLFSFNFDDISENVFQSNDFNIFFK